MEFENLKIDSKNKMEKTISILNETLVKIRSGRPHPSMLDGINVDYYGNPSPISQVANVSLVDARTLGVSPWEKSMLPQIEKAIRDSDLGLNPISLGDIIRVPMPPLSEERRKELLKVVKNEIESSKIVIRNIRRDSNSFLKDLEKKKTN